jgi:hypothetical protein
MFTRERSDMNMKKIEKEQLPKVIAIAVMAAGLLGYAAYSWLGHGGGGAPAAASLAHPAARKPPVTATPAPNDPLLALAPIEHENPFVPAFQASSAAPRPPAAKPAAKPVSNPAPPKPAAAPVTKIAALPDMLKGPAMDGDPGVALPTPAPAAKPAVKAQPAGGAAPKPASGAAIPAKPARVEGPKAPTVLVTGIIQGQEDVAILKWPDTHGQVVSVGDHLAGGYQVKAIRSDAVVVSMGAHEWVVRLGDEARS